jgi:hypothetical protein
VNSILLGLAVVWLLVFYLAWFLRICFRFHWVLILAMVLLVAGPALFLMLAPFGLIFVMGFFFAFERWEPLRGLFAIPRWPRAPIYRGPGRRRARAREFREPMPWLRGPNSY